MFPLIVNLQAEEVVIVGGGEIGYHKTLNLLKFGIKPIIISKTFHPKLKELEVQGDVILRKKAAQWQDLYNAFLVILVTDDEQLNDTLAKGAKEVGKLVIHASDVKRGNALVPATLQRGKLLLSVSTSGASPTLAKQIRDDLAEQYDERYVSFLEFLHEVRHIVKEKYGKRSDRRKWLQEAVNPLYIEDTKARYAFLSKL